MDMPILSNINYASVRKNNYDQSNINKVQKELEKISLKSSPFFELKFKKAEDQNSSLVPNIGHIIITKKNDKSSITYGVYETKKQDMIQIEIIADEDSAAIKLNSPEEKRTYEKLTREILALVHQSSGANFSYSCAKELLENTYEEAMSSAQGSHHIILKQPDEETLPGVEITSLDKDNIEIISKENIFRASTDDNDGLYPFERLSAQDTYQKNLFNALVGLAA
jgi:hypothetical protein